MILAVVLLGALWLHQHDVSVRETAAAVRSRDSLSLAVVRVRNEAQQRHSTDSIASARAIAVRDNALREARRYADSLEVVSGRLLDSLGGMVPVPDTVTAFVARVTAVVRATLAAKDAALSECQGGLTERDSRFVKLENDYARDLAGRDALIAEANRQLASAIRRSSPGLLARAWQALPWVAATAVGSVAVWEGVIRPKMR